MSAIDPKLIGQLATGLARVAARVDREARFGDDLLRALEALHQRINAIERRFAAAEPRAVVGPYVAGPFEVVDGMLL